MYGIFIFVWNQILQPRFKINISLIIAFVCGCLFLLLGAYLEHTLPRTSMIRTIGPLIILIAVVMILYKTPWYQNILAFVLTFLCASVPEVFLPTFLMTTEELSAGVYSLPAERQILIFGVCILLNTILLPAMCVGWKAIQKKQLWAIPARVWAVYLLIPLSQLYLILELASSQAYAAKKMIPILLSLFICFGADIVLLGIIRHTADYALMSIQNEMQQKEILAQKKYFEALTQQYSQIRKMRHDINNHIFTVQALLDNGEVNKAKEYLASVEESQNWERKSLLCGNMLVSTFLNARAETMLKAGIQLNCQADLPSELCVTDLDLITALGNLCDNAQEAAMESKVENPTVDMTLCIRNGYLAIKINNPAPYDEKPKERRIPEIERGVGSSILRELAEKYQGQYTVNAENGHCLVSLFLKV